METEIFMEEFKGFPVLAVWQVENGIKKGKLPIVSFGFKKAKAIVDNIEAIQEWVEEQEEARRGARKVSTPVVTPVVGSSNSVKVDLSNLNATQMESFKKFLQQK